MPCATRALAFLSKAEYAVFKEGLEADIRSLRESRARIGGQGRPENR